MNSYSFNPFISKKPQGLKKSHLVIQDKMFLLVGKYM